MDLGASILHHKSARVLNKELGLELVYILFHVYKHCKSKMLICTLTCCLKMLWNINGPPICEKRVRNGGQANFHYMTCKYFCSIIMVLR